MLGAGSAEPIVKARRQPRPPRPPERLRRKSIVQFVGSYRSRIRENSGDKPELSRV